MLFRSLAGAAQTPQNLATCMVTRVATLKLPSGGDCNVGGAGTGCSPVAWLAEVATPTYFNTTTEATSTQNQNLNITGSAADWVAYNNTIAIEVNLHSPTTLLGPALSRLFADVAAHGAFQATIGSNNIACVASCHPDFISYDEYTMDITNTDNGLGASAANWRDDQSKGILTLIAETGRPGWNPGGTLQGDGGAYQGNGNCAWNTNGMSALTLTAMTLFFASEKMAAVNYMAAWTMAGCIFAAPGAGGDHNQDASYEAVLAAAMGDATHPSQHTPLFCTYQNLARWPSGFTPGQELQIDSTCHGN